MASIKENGSIWPVCTLSKHAGEIRAFEQQIRSVDELVTACIQNVYAASQDEIFTGLCSSARHASCHFWPLHEVAL